MKPVLSFIKATLIGGIFFLLPVYLIFMLLYKVHLVATKILAPITHFLPENILGMNAGKLVAVFGLVLLCFLAGMLFKLSFMKKVIHYLEDRVLSHIPGYSLLKSKASDTLGEKIDYYLSAVMVEQDQSWRVGLLIDEMHGMSTVYFPIGTQERNRRSTDCAFVNRKKAQYSIKGSLITFEKFRERYNFTYKRELTYQVLNSKKSDYEVFFHEGCIGNKFVADK